MVIRDDVIVFRDDVTSCGWAAKVFTSPFGSTRGSPTAWSKDNALIGCPRHAVAEGRMNLAAAANVRSDSVVVITGELIMIRKPQETSRETRTSWRDQAMT
jgi:hypothetical protein